jgi:hypothetical protein
MNRSIKAALGGLAALALTTTGLSTAAATEKDEYPKRGELIKINAKFTLPAGSACVDKIKVKQNSAVRVTDLSKTKYLVEFKDWSRVTFYNPKTHKKITVGEGSRAIVKTNKKKDVSRVKATGENTFIGAGIQGIVYTKGKVHFTIYNDGTPEQVLEIDKVHGKYIELCKKLGSRPAKVSYDPPVVSH